MSNKEVKNLTAAQKAKIPQYIEEYTKIQLSTEACDRVKAENAIKASYKFLNLPEPTFVWADSPFAGVKIAAQLAEGKEDVTAEEINKQKDYASFGSFEAYWVAFYDFIATEVHGKKDDLIEVVKEIIKNCGVYWTFEDIVVMTDKPCAIHHKMVNGQQKLDNPRGLALEYRDGRGVFANEGNHATSMLDQEIARKLGTSGDGAK